MNYKDYNDYELIYMVREKDDYYKNILYEKYSPVIYKLATEFYNRYSKYGYDLDDFIQEAMIAFENAVAIYDESNSMFYTFLIVCIKRRLLSFTRDISRVKKSYPLLLSDEYEDYNSPDIKTDIESIMCNQELQDICKSIIYDIKISIDVTSIFELRLNGFTYREIGELLDIPSSSVEFKIRKARKKLKLLLNKYYE